MTIAYQPNGQVFIFDEDGETIARDLPDKSAALTWILRERGRARKPKP